MREQFGHLGIGAERLELSGPEESFTAHLAGYGAVDIALDVFPYNGAATTCEALWMGVPVVTLAGPTHVSRVGASILGCVGIPELVADSREAYLQKALGLARDPERLAALRTGMRKRLQASPLLDATGFARSLENAYLDVWERWVREEEARDPEPLAASSAEGR
jgi:predicted O-linked N-acetylglucosamine transferase (SPINDLY family)